MYATDCATITERLKSTNLKNWTCFYIQEHAQSHYSLLYLFCVVGVRKLPNKMLSLCLTHTLSRTLSRFCDFSSDIPLFSIAFSFFCLKNPNGNQWIFVLYVFVHTEFWKRGVGGGDYGFWCRRSWRGSGWPEGNVKIIYGALFWKINKFFECFVIGLFLLLIIRFIMEGCSWV